jgi:hypothetical protein
MDLKRRDRMDINTLQIRAFFESDDESVYLKCANEQAQESLRVRAYREKKLLRMHDVRIAKRTIGNDLYVVLKREDPDKGAAECFKMVDGVLIPIKYDLPKQKTADPVVNDKEYLERRIKLMREEGMSDDEIRSYLTEAEAEELEGTDDGEV